jgi:serine/threonine-protein kinase
MSPEQLAGDEVDARSDIYSLGLVAFNMLTGTLPFPTPASQEALIARLTDDPRTLAETKPEVPWPPELEVVMRRVLARNPEERYQSAREFAIELVRAVADLPDLSLQQVSTRVVAAQGPRDTAEVGTTDATLEQAAPTLEAPPEVPAASGARAAAPTPAARSSLVATAAPAAPPTPADAELAPPPPTGRGVLRSHRGAFVAGIAVALAAITGAAYFLSSRDSQAPPSAVEPPAVVTAAVVTDTSPTTPQPSAGDSLARVPATAAPPVAAPPAAPAVREEPPTPAPAELRLSRTLPAGTTVLVNGSPVGERPVTLPPGRSTVTVQLPGGERRSYPLSVAAGERVAWPPARIAAELRSIAAGPPAPQPTGPGRTTGTPAESARVVDTAASPPPVTQPTTGTGRPVAPATPPVSTGIDRAAAMQEFQAAIGRFVGAFETRRIDEVRRVYPGMTPQSAEQWQGLLGERLVSDVQTSVERIGTPEFTSNEAQVSFIMRLEYKVRSQRQTADLQYQARFRREGGAWQMTSVVGR